MFCPYYNKAASVTRLRQSTSLDPSLFIQCASPTMLTNNPIIYNKVFSSNNTKKLQWIIIAKIKTQYTKKMFSHKFSLETCFKYGERINVIGKCNICVVKCFCRNNLAASQNMLRVTMCCEFTLLKEVIIWNGF